MGNALLYDKMLSDKDVMFNTLKTQADDEYSRREEMRKEMMTKMAEAQAGIAKSNEERRTESEESADRERKLYEKRIEDKEKHYEDMMQRETERRLEMKEHHKMYMEMFKDMHMESVSQHTKQIEALSKGLESVNEGVKQIQLMFTGEKSAINASGQTSDSNETLKHPCSIIIDNIGSFDDLREFTSKDQDTLQTLFQSVGSDTKEVRRGENLTTASKECGQNDYTEYDAIIVSIFAPGCNMTLIDGSRQLKIKKLCEPFVFNPTLAGKPKIFLIHAIRKHLDHLDEEEYSPAENVLVCYCELSEELYRNTSTDIGSFFIKSLGYVFGLYSKSSDLEEILEKLRSEVMVGQEENISFCVAGALKTKVYFGNA